MDNKLGIWWDRSNMWRWIQNDYRSYDTILPWMFWLFCESKGPHTQDAFSLTFISNKFFFSWYTVETLNIVSLKLEKYEICDVQSLLATDHLGVGNTSTKIQRLESVWQISCLPSKWVMLSNHICWNSAREWETFTEN